MIWQRRLGKLMYFMVCRIEIMVNDVNLSILPHPNPLLKEREQASYPLIGSTF